MKALIGGLAAVALAAPAAQAGSLPSVQSGHQPGPDALYEPTTKAPQLTNVKPFRGRPILISGASAYRRGEFMYQDFLYDSHGAAGVKDSADPFSADAFLFSPKAGTMTYPSDPVFANNAADLVEFRIKAMPEETLLRITLNSIADPERTAATIAIGNSDEPRAWPHGAGVRSPAQYFLTVHGTTAEFFDYGKNQVLGNPPVGVDLERRQITISVPHRMWDPIDTVDFAVGVGLWDPQTDEYLAPAESRSETQPGGASPSGSRIFNMAFRGPEPVPDLASIPAGVTIGDAAAGAAYLGSWWREKLQADTLANGDVSSFRRGVDFNVLVANERDDSGVPKDGPMDRILSSHRSFGDGIDYTKLCGGIEAAGGPFTPCDGPLVGQLQPYAIYVPKKPVPKRGYGLTLLMHSLSANYNQYLGSKNQSQLGERGDGSIVITPAGRGPDGFYRDIAEADSFEVWADVARRFKLDPELTAASGYSMGGIGTFRMLSRWPDLFARGFSVVGRGDPDADLASLRNTPVMMWNAAADELVNVSDYEATVSELTRLGLRFASWVFLASDHLTIATNDEYGPGADFLGTHRVDRDPAHVTYVVDPETNSERAASVADHAYWLSGLTVKEGAARGTIDVRSLGFGHGDAPVGQVQSGSGTLEGGTRGPTPYMSQTLDWGEEPTEARADKLIVTSTDVATAVVDASRARVSCAPEIELHGDVALQVACSPPPKCIKRLKLKLPSLKGRIQRVQVRRNGKRVKFTRRGRTVVIRRGGRGKARIAIRIRLRNRQTVTVTRTFARC